MPTGGFTYYFRDTNGRISQINGVTKITFATPLIADGWYRDKPPIVVGGAAASASGGVFTDIELQAVIAGGVQPTSTGGTVTATGASSVLQDDDYTHAELRFIWAPVPLVFFKTVNAITASNPDDSTFSKTRPVGTFDSFDADCIFSWGEDCAIFNAPPQGWEKTESYPAITDS